MIEDFVGALVRSQVGALKKRTGGALLELLAVGMVGLAVAFLFVGLFLWLSSRMEPWLAAMVLSLLALAVALALLLAGRAVIRRAEEQRRQEALSGLEALELLLRPGKGGGDAQKDAPALVGAALAAGLLLGRAMKR
jgi:FtsH-binding integral membrane protein